MLWTTVLEFDIQYYRHKYNRNKVAAENLQAHLVQPIQYPTVITIATGSLEAGITFPAGMPGLEVYLDWIGPGVLLTVDHVC